MRVTLSALTRLILNARIEDQIQFAEATVSSLTYALECSPHQREVHLRYRQQEYHLDEGEADRRCSGTDRGRCTSSQAE